MLLLYSYAKEPCETLKVLKVNDSTYCSYCKCNPEKHLLGWLSVEQQTGKITMKCIT